MRDPASTSEADYPARVTVIIAAYGRPGALRAAIQSVCNQTIADWRVLVVGDCCSGEVAAVAEAQEDPRIRFINLPQRFGEQSGPNTVGMALADTPYLAFLSHDEVYLPDHLERSLDILKTSRADFCLSGNAKSRVLTSTENGHMRPKFCQGSTFRRGLSESFLAHPFEPCSAWVFRHNVFERVGGWRPRAHLFRPSVNDWAMRVWRSGAATVNQPVMTVLHVVTHRQPSRGKPFYETTETGHDWLAWAVSRFDAESLRTLVEADIRETDGKQTARARRHRSTVGSGSSWRMTVRTIRNRLRGIGMGILVNRWTGLLYYWLGLDTFTLYSRMVGVRRGNAFRRALRKRVGEDAPSPPDLAEMVAWVRDKVR